MISVELILETFERQKNEILENISKTTEIFERMNPLLRE